MTPVTVGKISTVAPLRAVYECIVTVEIPGLTWAQFRRMVAEGQLYFCGQYHWFRIGPTTHNT